MTVLFCLVWAGMPGRTLAWHTFTHPYLARIAFDQMDGDFQATFEDHLAAVVAGAMAPDLVLFDWYNHEWNVHSEEAGQGGAPDRIEALFDTILARLKEAEPDYPKLANDLGLLAHYLADINQPLHTDEADLEGLVHGKYEWDVFNREMTFSFLDHGRTFFLDPRAETIEMAESANRYYDQVMESYISGIGYEGLERVTALQVQEAVDAIADAWTTLWFKATASGPSVGIRTSQAFFRSGERVEIFLSTLAGKTSNPVADIYVAVADQWSGLLFIGSQGISERPPVAWRSGVILSDEKSVILAFELGEVVQERCYGIYAVAVPRGQDPLDPQWWLGELATASVCLAPP